jgi:hypothetical protein
MEIRKFIEEAVRECLNEQKNEQYLRPLLLANGFVDKKNGEYQYNNFKLTIRGQVEYSPNGDYMMEINDDRKISVIDSVINNDKESTGNGSKLLDLIIKLADESKTTLQLIPKPIGHKKLNKNQLIKWYKSRGFDFINKMVMQRNPN